MRIAIVQDGPVYLNKKETLNKTLSYIAAAAGANVDVIVFGENWFSGYPVWLDICSDVNIWDSGPVKKVWADTFTNGLSLDSPELETLKESAKAHAMTLIIGANEPVSKGIGNGTIYNTIYTISHEGHITNHHRKLMPTYTERLVHGRGDASGLKAIDTPHGRIGSLICWEHWMPLSRQAMHDEAEDVHFALWPQVKEQNHIASRHYAIEGRCFTVAAGQVMHRDELPSRLSISSQVKLLSDGLIMRGGSAVYGPDGAIIVEPVWDERKLIVTDIDISTLLAERMNLAVSGHYQRPDLFEFRIKK